MKDKARYDADIQTLAKTLYGEARGEYTKVECGLAALIAVGNVIVNRWENVHRWPHTIRGVCRESHQFSCWSPTDPNYKLLQEDLSFDSVFNVCLDLAALMVNDPDFPDLTKGATHYLLEGDQAPLLGEGQTPHTHSGEPSFFQSYLVKETFIMPISAGLSRFSTTGKEEVGGDAPFPPVDCWHVMKIRELIDQKTSKGKQCYVQTAEFLSFETPLTVRTFYLEGENWSIGRLDNMFRNLSYTSRADINGIEFNAKIRSRPYKDSKTGEARKGLEIKWMPLWAKVEDFEKELQKVPNDLRVEPPGRKQPLPSGVPEPLAASGSLEEDEIPF